MGIGKKTDERYHVIIAADGRRVRVRNIEVLRADVIAELKDGAEPGLTCRALAVALKLGGARLAEMLQVLKSEGEVECFEQMHPIQRKLTTYWCLAGQRPKRPSVFPFNAAETLAAFRQTARARQRGDCVAAAADF